MGWAYRELMPKAPPFDLAQGRLSRKEREKWPTRRKKKKFLDGLSNSGPPFDYMVKAGQPARKKK